MAQLENNFILNAQSNPFYSQIIMFFRFIDDCFCIFSDASKISEFLDWFNTIHGSIKFTMEGSTKEVHFLDTVVYKDSDSKLAVKLYIQPTDKNNYLHFNSFHRMKMNIPYGQFLRIRRNSMHDRDYQTHADRLKQQFLQRGYPAGVIDTAEVRARHRETLCLPLNRMTLLRDYFGL